MQRTHNLCMIIMFFIFREQRFHKTQVQEKENWTRLSYLLIDQGTLCIRQIIIDKLDNDFKIDFKQLVEGNKRNINNCTYFLKNQKTLLLTNTQNDVIEKCDLTLLILLVGFFKVLPIPPCGWYSQTEPDPRDLDPSSDVMRLRFMRNDLYHSVQCAIPQADFEKKWAKGTEILRRLNARQSAMDKIKPRRFEVVERRYYVKVIRYLFSSDRPDAEEYIKKRIKAAQLIPMRQPGPSTGEKVICSKCNKRMRTICSDCTSTGEKVMCSKCNRQYSNICSDCTSGHHSGSQPELSKLKQMCSECNRPIGNICSDCSSRQSRSESDLNTGEQVTCTESNTSTGTTSSNSSSDQSVSKQRHLFEKKEKD